MAGAHAFSDRSDRSSELASKIALVLGCPIEALSNPDFSGFDQTGELLQIWLTIEHEQDRRKVLSFVRMIADQATIRRET